MKHGIMCDASRRVRKRLGAQSFIVNWVHLYPLSSLHNQITDPSIGKQKIFSKVTKEKNKVLYIKTKLPVRVLYLEVSLGR